MLKEEWESGRRKFILYRKHGDEKEMMNVSKVLNVFYMGHWGYYKKFNNKE